MDSTRSVSVVLGEKDNKSVKLEKNTRIGKIVNTMFWFDLFSNIFLYNGFYNCFFLLCVRC